MWQMLRRLIRIFPKDVWFSATTGERFLLNRLNSNDGCDSQRGHTNYTNGHTQTGLDKTVEFCVRHTAAHLVFHFVIDLGLGRRVVDEDRQQTEWTASDVDVDGAWCDMTADVFQDDSTLRQRQAAFQRVTGVEQFRQSTVTSIIQFAVRLRPFVGCPSAKHTITTLLKNTLLKSTSDKRR